MTTREKMKPNKTARILEDPKINVKIKLALLWVTVMFLYIYVDYFTLYIPGRIEDIVAGIVWKFQITQTWALFAMILTTIHITMIFLSMTLKAKANRLTNIIMGILHILLAIANAIGETWAFYIFGTIAEIVLFLLIIRYAWKWPLQEA